MCRRASNEAVGIASAHNIVDLPSAEWVYSIDRIYIHFISPIHGSENTHKHTHTYTRTRAHKYT